MIKISVTLWTICPQSKNHKPIISLLWEEGDVGHKNLKTHHPTHILDMSGVVWNKDISVLQIIVLGGQLSAVVAQPPD